MNNALIGGQKTILFSKKTRFEKYSVIMNVFKRAFTPNESKQKRKSLPPLRGIKSKPSSKVNPLDVGDVNQFAYQSQNEEIPLTDAQLKKPRKGQFTINNLRIKQFTDEEIQGCFDSFDLDGNGFISAAEIAQCFRKLGEKVTDQEIDEMIKMCDLVETQRYID